VYLLDVFPLVLVRDFNLLTAWLHLDADSFSEPLVFRRKRKFKCVRDIVVPAPWLAAISKKKYFLYLQHPFQVSVEISIHTLHILQRHLLPQNHLVESSDKESIQKSAVENGQTNNTTNELEVVQMFRVDAGVRVDLESVVVVCWLFEQTVEGVEHFVGKQEEEFSVFMLAVIFPDLITMHTEKDLRSPVRLLHRIWSLVASSGPQHFASWSRDMNLQRYEFSWPWRDIALTRYEALVASGSKSACDGNHACTEARSGLEKKVIEDRPKSWSSYCGQRSTLWRYWWDAFPSQKAVDQVGTLAAVE
jgi:hypothetical protein